MEIRPAGNIPYTKETWDDYKNRLMNTLRKNAVDADQIFNDVELKNYIVSYVENELINEKKDNERLLLNINIRLVHFEIESSTGKRVFPIINEYKGHHLMRTYYFYKDANDKCQMGCVEVNTKPIIIS